MVDCASSSSTTTSSSSANRILPPIKVFPACLFGDLQSRYGDKNVKLIHMIRHAEGTHNVNKEYKDIRNLDAPLTAKGIQQCISLSQSEAVQSIVDRHLNKNRNNNYSNKLGIVTSTMTRCIQTVLYSFADLLAKDQHQQCDNESKVPIIAHESLRETVNFHCDRRRPLDELLQEFNEHGVDFSSLQQYKEEQQHDPIWEYYRSRLPRDWDDHMESAMLDEVVLRAWDGLLSLVSSPPLPQRNQQLQQQLQQSTQEFSEIVICSHSAFLRCIFNYGQHGGVPQLIPQNLLDDHFPHDDDYDDRKETTAATFPWTTLHHMKKQRIFEFCHQMPPPDHDGTKNDHEKTSAAAAEFEENMRRNYDNCELRSFCFLFHDDHRTAQYARRKI